LGNYVRTGPFTNSVTPPGISASFLNAIEAVLEQPTGGSELGKYFITGSTYAIGAYVCQYMISLSRTSVPVSVVIDTADQAASNFNAPTTIRLTSSGFQVQVTGTGANLNCNVGGNWTINY
jgi:hypothetical protein